MPIPNETADKATLSKTPVQWFSAGLLFWSVFSIAIVLIRGVRWDEHYEFAEVILGTVPYPEHHPLGLSLHYMHNILIYLTTGIVWLFPGPEVINGFRNMAWMLGLLLPLYLFGNSLSRNVRAGHLAVLLALFGVYLEFDSNYALHNWPGYYSNGHIGRSIAFILLWSFLAGHRRSAFLLCGFMAAVHPVHALPVLLLMGCRMLWELRLGDARAAVLRPVLWVVPGVLVCLFLWASPWTSPLSMPTEGAYFSEVSGTAIMDGFLVNDPHRALPGTVIPITNPMFILAATLMLCIGRFLVIPRADRANSMWTWLCVYLSIVTSIVWGIMLVHLVMGHDIPGILIGWMPYRFSNHAAILSLAILSALLLENNAPDERRTPFWMLSVSGLVLFEVIKPLFSSLVGADLYSRYFADGSITLFALFGIAAARVYGKSAVTGVLRIGFLITLLVSILVLLNFHRFGAVCIVGTFLLSIVYIRFDPDAWAKYRFEAVLTGLILVSIAVITVHEYRNRIHLYQTDFERNVQVYFEDTEQSDALVAARPDQYGLQGRIHQPILIDDAIHTGIPYMVHLAPMIQKIHEDWYNTRFYPAMPADEPSWTEVWQTRTLSDWVVLSDEYTIHYIISPNTVPLHLPVVIEGESDTLYRIGLE